MHFGIQISSKIYFVYLTEDGVSEPRATSSIDGSQLPNVRQISNVVHAGTGKARSSKFLTLHTFQFGQFLDHDLIATPRQAGMCLIRRSLMISLLV